MVDDYDPIASVDIGAARRQILAVPFVTGLPGWAYNREESDVYAWLNRILDDNSTTPSIFVSHAPPYKIRDAVGKKHYGCMAFNKWFHEPGAKPEHWIVGHIHDSYGVEHVDGCTFHNAAMCNEKYEQVNPALVIDL